MADKRIQYSCWTLPCCESLSGNKLFKFNYNRYFMEL
jgi:hypothetical protein